jgi:glyoxylase-like metal-dependent hydrolase (beta-lactamase superfamily II)
VAALLGSRSVGARTRSVGPVEVTAIVDADFPGGPIIESFPDAPADGILGAKAAYPGVYTDDDQWRLRVRAWVVRHPEGVLLLDTGIGGATAPAHEWAPVTGALEERLAEIDVAPHHVDTVAISHVHDDHIGGVLADDGRPRFPNARYLVQRTDMEWLRQLAPTSEEDAVILAHVQPLVDEDRLDLLDGDHDLSAHLQLHHLPGHTPGHQIVRVVADGHRLVLSADTWNHPAQFAHPDWPSGPDAHHAQAAAARRAMLAELLSHPGTVLAPTHLAEAFGEVRSGRDGLAAWYPLDRDGA